MDPELQKAWEDVYRARAKLQEKFDRPLVPFPLVLILGLAIFLNIFL